MDGIAGLFVSYSGGDIKLLIAFVFLTHYITHNG
jgi:hypothetical protein